MIVKIDEIHRMSINEYGRHKMINKAIQEHQEMIEALRDLKTGIACNKVTKEIFDNIKEELGDCINVNRKVEIMLNIDHLDIMKGAKEKMKRTLKLMSEDDFAVDVG